MLAFMEPTGPRSLEDWLIKRIEEIGISLVDLADKVGVEPQTLWNWRVGKHNPRPTKKRALEDAVRWQRGSYDAIKRGLPPIPVAKPLEEDAPEVPESPAEVSATRVELNKVADWIALWKGEGAAEEFMAWALAWRAQHKSDDTSVTA